MPDPLTLFTHTASLMRPISPSERAAHQQLRRFAQRQHDAHLTGHPERQQFATMTPHINELSIAAEHWRA